MIEKYAALLEYPWQRGTDTDDIRAFWAEDGCPFIINCPSQLRDLLIDIQQKLSCKYHIIEQKKRELEKLSSELNEVLS